MKTVSFQNKMPFFLMTEKLAPQNGNYDILKNTPYGNSIVTDFAIETIKKEDKRPAYRYFNISYSSTDYVGHKFALILKKFKIPISGWIMN